MRAHPISASALGLFLILGVCVVGAAGMSHTMDGFQVEQEEAVKAKPEAEGQEKVYGEPKDIKEAWAIYVFLGWLWLSILVLIYLLRLKIRECDRLDNFDYFLNPDKPHREA
jgi:hypothetical protein